MPLLNSIAEIRMGATLRGRDATRAVPDGTYRFLRIGDLTQEGTCRTDNLIRIEPNEPISEALHLRPGDVLFPNRGTRTTAFVFPGSRSPTIVGPQFFIVRAKPAAVLPDYLAWYLRSSHAAAHFDSRRKGSYVPIIQRRDLAELEIPIPPLTVQAKILEVATLALQERDLSDRILRLRWQYSREHLVGLARKSCKPS